MGILRTRSRSVWPGVLMQALHNGLVAGAAFGGTGLVDLEPLVASQMSGPVLAALGASTRTAGVAGVARARGGLTGFVHGCALHPSGDGGTLRS